MKAIWNAIRRFPPGQIVIALQLGLLVAEGLLGFSLLLDYQAASRRVLPTAMPSPAATVTVPATPQPPTATPQRPAATRQPVATATRPNASAPPTRIVAPAINLDAPVVEIGWKPVLIGGMEAREWEVAANAAGFHRGMAYPGHPGNTVISGHHNLDSQVFRYLVDLEYGDEVILFVGEESYRYIVTDVQILQEFGVDDEQRIENARWIAPTDDERLTLVTCWPYSGNSHRVIVVARPLF